MRDNPLHGRMGRDRDRRSSDLTELVTVLMPVYNPGVHLRAAVESLRAQTYRHIEILVINDGSTDGAAALLASYARMDGRIRVIDQPNAGLVASLNKGLRLATGDLVARMDADDVAYPDRIGRQVEAFRRNPDLAMLGMSADYLYGRNRVFPGPGQAVGATELRVQNIFSPVLVHPSIMFNRKVLSPEILSYDAAYLHSEDYDLIRRVTATREAAMLAEPGLAWRQGHASVSRRFAADQSRMHFRIVGEQLHAAGVLDDPTRLEDACAAMTEPGHDGRALQATLRQIEAFGRSLPPDQRSAYEVGFRSLFIPLQRRLAALERPGLLVDLLDEGGLDVLVPRKARLLHRAGRMVGNRTVEKAMGLASRVTFGLRTENMSRRASLPPSVVAALSR